MKEEQIEINENRFFSFPKSRIGVYSVIFFILAHFLFVILALAAVLVTAAEMYSGFIPTLFAFIGYGVYSLIIISGIYALITIIHKKERSFLLWISFLVSLYYLIGFGIETLLVIVNY